MQVSQRPSILNKQNNEDLGLRVATVQVAMQYYKHTVDSNMHRYKVAWHCPSQPHGHEYRGNTGIEGTQSNCYNMQGYTTSGYTSSLWHVRVWPVERDLAIFIYNERTNIHGRTAGYHCVGFSRDKLNFVFNLFSKLKLLICQFQLIYIFGGNWEWPFVPILLSVETNVMFLTDYET